MVNQKLKPFINKNSQGSIIRMNKNWISCANPNSVVLSAFKMACLSYSPSKVIYKNKSYARTELHLRKVYMVDKLKSVLQDLHPWWGLQNQISKRTEFDVKESEVESKFHFESERQNVLNELPFFSSSRDEVNRASNNTLSVDRKLSKYVENFNRRPKTNVMNKRIESESVYLPSYVEIKNSSFLKNFDSINHQNQSPSYEAFEANNAYSSTYDQPEFKTQFNFKTVKVASMNTKDTRSFSHISTQYNDKNVVFSRSVSKNVYINFNIFKF